MIGTYISIIQIHHLFQYDNKSSDRKKYNIYPAQPFPNRRSTPWTMVHHGRHTCQMPHGALTSTLGILLQNGYNTGATTRSLIKRREETSIRSPTDQGIPSSHRKHQNWNINHIQQSSPSPALFMNHVPYHDSESDK